MHSCPDRVHHARLRGALENQWKQARPWLVLVHPRPKGALASLATRHHGPRLFQKLKAHHSDWRKISVFDEIRKLEHPRDRIDLHRSGTSAPCSQDKRVVRTRRMCTNGVQIVAVLPRGSNSKLGMDQPIGCSQDVYSRDQRKVHHLPGDVREWARLALVCSPPWTEKPVNGGDNIRHGVFFPCTVYQSEARCCTDGDLSLAILTDRSRNDHLGQHVRTFDLLCL